VASSVAKTHREFIGCRHKGEIGMTNQASRTRSGLAILKLVAALAVLAGCRLDGGTGCPPKTPPFQARHYASGNWCPECGQCSCFHPTVWQPWQEGRMAMLCRQGETETAPFGHDLNGRAEPTSPAGSVPEAIPLPNAQPGKEPAATDRIEPSSSGAPPALPDAPSPPESVPQSKAQSGKESTTTDRVEPSPSGATRALPDAPSPPVSVPQSKEPTLPGLVEPSPSSPLPKKETEKGQSPVPDQGNEPAPTKKTDYEQPSDEVKSWGFAP